MYLSCTCIVDITIWAQMYERCLANRSGKPADCIPQLARIDPSKWGVSLCTTDGQRFNIGDVKEEFSIQSARWAVGFLICGCRILNHTIVVCFSNQLSCQRLRLVLLEN